MDVGLLNATQYCAKGHDRKRMILQKKYKAMVSFMNYNHINTCCQFHLSDIWKLKPEMFLAFPFLHSKVKRGSRIKVVFMWTDVTSPLIKYWYHDIWKRAFE